MAAILNDAVSSRLRHPIEREQQDFLELSHSRLDHFPAHSSDESGDANTNLANDQAAEGHQSASAEQQVPMESNDSNTIAQFLEEIVHSERAVGHLSSSWVKLLILKSRVAHAQFHLDRLMIRTAWWT